MGAVLAAPRGAQFTIKLLEVPANNHYIQINGLHYTFTTSHKRGREAAVASLLGDFPDAKVIQYFIERPSVGSSTERRVAAVISLAAALNDVNDPFSPVMAEIDADDTSLLNCRFHNWLHASAVVASHGAFDVEFNGVEISTSTVLPLAPDRCILEYIADIKQNYQLNSNQLGMFSDLRRHIRAASV